MSEERRIWVNLCCACTSVLFCFPVKRTAIAMRPGGMKTHTSGGLSVRISVLRRVRELRVASILDFGMVCLTAARHEFVYRTVFSLCMRCCACLECA